MQTSRINNNVYNPNFKGTSVAVNKLVKMGNLYREKFALENECIRLFVDNDDKVVLDQIKEDELEKLEKMAEEIIKKRKKKINSPLFPFINKFKDMYLEYYGYTKHTLKKSLKQYADENKTDLKAKEVLGTGLESIAVELCTGEVLKISNVKINKEIIDAMNKNGELSKYILPFKNYRQINGIVFYTQPKVKTPITEEDYKEVKTIFNKNNLDILDGGKRQFGYYKNRPVLIDYGATNRELEYKGLSKKEYIKQVLKIQ